MSSHTVNRKHAERPVHIKSTAKARQLIEAAVRRCGTETAAARALGLPTQAQLSRMRRGLLADTPEMKAALERARIRADRAWLMVREQHVERVDTATVHEVIDRVEKQLAMLKALVKRAPASPMATPAARPIHRREV